MPPTSCRTVKPELCVSYAQERFPEKDGAHNKHTITVSNSGPLRGLGGLFLSPVRRSMRGGTAQPRSLVQQGGLLVVHLLHNTLFMLTESDPLRTKTMHPTRTLSSSPLEVKESGASNLWCLTSALHNAKDTAWQTLRRVARYDGSPA